MPATKPAITLLDDATRPKAPKIDGVTEAQRAQGQHLAYIHAFHLEQIDAVRRVMDEVEAGAKGAAALPGAVDSMAMLGNVRTFGNVCGRECRMLSLHHMIEDQTMFPPLFDASERAGSDGLRKVVDRLVEEHHVVHQLLEALQDAAVNAATEPSRDSFAALKAAFVTLERVIRSHFGYEQTELEEALGYYDVPV